MIRFNKYPDKTVRSMAEEAVELVLKDASLNNKNLQAAFYSNTFWGMFSNQHSIRGQVILRGMGIDRIPVTNVENAVPAPPRLFTWPIWESALACLM